MKALFAVLILCVVAALAQDDGATVVQLGDTFTATWTLPLDTFDVEDSTGSLEGTFFEPLVYKVWVNASSPGFSVNLLGTAGVPAFGSNSYYDYLYVYVRPYAPACGYPEYSVEPYSYYPCKYYNFEYDSFYVDTTSTGEIVTFNNYYNDDDWAVGAWYYIRIDGERYSSSSYAYNGVLSVQLEVVESDYSCSGSEVPYGYDYDSTSYIECGAAPMTLDPTTGNYWAWNVTNGGDLLWMINTTDRYIGQIIITANITMPSDNIDSNWALRARSNAIPTYYSHCDYDYFNNDGAWAEARIVCYNIEPGTFYLELTSYYSDYVSYKESWNGTLNLWVEWQECPAGWAGAGCAEPVWELGLDTVVGVNRTILWNTDSHYNAHYYWVNITEEAAANIFINPVIFYITEYTGSLDVYVRYLAPPCDGNSLGCSDSNSFDVSYTSTGSVYSYYVPIYQADVATWQAIYIGVVCDTSSYNCTYAITRDVPAPPPVTSTTTSATSAQTSAQTSATMTTTTAATSAQTSATMTTTTTTAATSAQTSATMTTTTTAMGTTTSRATTTTAMGTTSARGTTTGAGTTSGMAVTTGSATSVAASVAMFAIVAVAMLF